MARAYTARVSVAAEPPDYQLVVYTSDQSRTFDLPKRGTVTIGRGEGSAVRIDDQSVSRNHALLHLGPVLSIEDLGSANGTTVRDRADKSRSGETLSVRQLHGRRSELAVGETILFGTASVIVRHAPAPVTNRLATDAGVVVRDPQMRALYEEAALAARSPINVLILGPSGVGKEILARVVHDGSPRAKQVFLGIDCSTLNNESLAESELFGHEQGAFTGAARARPGLLESAKGGTVFLDEVGNLSLGTQAKLLRVLQEREVLRVGANRPRPIDVRFIAATNRDLEAECRAGRFREDLLFRLNAATLVVPPLGARATEIEPLANLFLVEACRQIERAKAPAFSGAALDVMRAFGWPGNVRELRNVVERATALCPGDTIGPEHLPTALLASTRPPAAANASAGGSLQRDIDALERSRIVEALERCGGSQSRAAKLLGISRGTLLDRLDRFGIARPRKREVETGP